MIEIKIKDKGGRSLGDTSHPIQRALGLLGQAAKNVRPALEDIGEMLLRSTDNRFEAEKDPDGQPWAPLSPEHLAYKEEKGFNLKILQMRGHMRGTIIWKVSGQTLIVGTNRVYAGIHQFGGTVKFKAREGSLKLRTDRKGNLLRQNQVGVGPHRRGTGNLAIFARGGHKRVVQRKFSVGPYQVTIPPRPFLGLSVEDQADALDILREHMLEALSKA